MLSVTDLDNHPKYVTKYFKLSDCKYYGRVPTLKFGTAACYRKQEEYGNGVDARADVTEGTIIWDVDVDIPGYYGKIDVPGLYLTGGAFGLRMKNGKVHKNYNERIFCCSIGPYNRDNHKKIIQPSKEGYIGNRNLLGYVVFDLNSLISRVTKLAKKHELYQVESEKTFIYCNKVTYDKTSTKLEIKTPTLSEKVEGLSMSDWKHIFFAKPAIFQPENEFRILLSMNYPLMISEDSPPIYLTSASLHRSIVDIGYYKN